MLSIFTAIAISTVFGYEQYSQSTNNYEHLSSLLNDDSLCFDTSDEQPVEVCYTLDELETFGCSKPLLEYLAQYSNLLDPEFPEMFIIEWPSLPNNVSEEDYDACVEFLNSARLPLNQENKDSVYSLPFGMTTEDIENMIHVGPIYRNDPNNSGELILDIDAMQQVQKILDKCEYVQKLESGEIPSRNPDGSYNIVTSSLRFYNNGTHYIDTNFCKWVDSLESVTYNCFEAKPAEQNWYFGPSYFDNGTHHIDVQYCNWEIKNEN